MPMKRKDWTPTSPELPVACEDLDDYLGRRLVLRHLERRAQRCKAEEAAEAAYWKRGLRPRQTGFAGDLLLRQPPDAKDKDADDPHAFRG